MRPNGNIDQALEAVRRVSPKTLCARRFAHVRDVPVHACTGGRYCTGYCKPRTS